MDESSRVAVAWNEPRLILLSVTNAKDASSNAMDKFRVSAVRDICQPAFTLSEKAIWHLGGKCASESHR